MKFQKEWLLSVLDGDDSSAKVVRDRIIDHRRWSVIHEMVFEHNGKFYKSDYSTGATECQDEHPYQYDDNEIECPEVKPVEKTIIVYEKV